jgi:hypothetical protein
MQHLPGVLRGRARTVTGFVAGLALISLPVEITIGLAEHPVVAPAPAVSLLLVSSCLLLVGSGLGLRRLEAMRVGAPRPTPGL